MRALLGTLLLAAVAAAHPHAAPSLWIDIEIREREVVWTVSTRIEHLQGWLGDAVRAEDLAEPMAPALDEAARNALQDFFARKNPVTIDGVRAAPEVRRIFVPKDDQGIEYFEYRSVVVAYPCERAPERVSFVWEAFEAAGWQERVAVPLVITAAPHVDTNELKPEEPEYVWHRLPERKPRVAPVPIERSETRRLLGLGALVLGGTCALFRYFRPAAPALALGIALLLPVWGGSVPRPSASQARAILTTLQRNVYDAFVAPNHRAIYDLLAASAEPALVERLYLDILEELIQQQEGNAVARVDRVEPVTGEIHFPEEEEARFDADWRWRVHCSVTHWGHTHERINEYVARFSVRHGGESWKISDMEVRAKERLDEGGGG